MLEFISVMACIVLAYFATKPRKKESTTFTELAKVVKTMVFVEIEKVPYKDETIYLGFDLYNRKFLGQASTCIQLYDHIFQNKSTLEIIWAKLEENEDTLIRIDKTLVAESVAHFS